MIMNIYRNDSGQIDKIVVAGSPDAPFRENRHTCNECHCTLPEIESEEDYCKFCRCKECSALANESGYCPDHEREEKSC